MIPRDDYHPHSRRASMFLAAAAAVACFASLSAVVVLFDSAGSTSWFAADQALLVTNCEPVHQASQRHACLQAAAKQTATTRVSAR
jgi:hypothetical protein